MFRFWLASVSALSAVVKSPLAGRAPWDGVVFTEIPGDVADVWGESLPGPAKARTGKSGRTVGASCPRRRDVERTDRSRRRIARNPATPSHLTEDEFKTALVIVALAGTKAGISNSINPRFGLPAPPVPTSMPGPELELLLDGEAPRALHPAAPGCRR